MRMYAYLVSLQADKEHILQEFTARGIGKKGHLQYPYQRVKLLPESEYEAVFRRGETDSSPCYIFRQHFRGRDRQWYIPAFKLQGLDQAEDYVLQYAAELDGDWHELHYDSETCLYFDLPMIKREFSKDRLTVDIKYCNDLKQAALGSINAGDTWLRCQRKSDRAIVGAPRLMRILPSSMTQAQYVMMVNDILRIERNLIADEAQGKQTLPVVARWQANFAEIESAVQELTGCFKLIEQSPHVRLQRKIIQIPREKIKHYTPRVMRQILQKNHSEKYSSFTYEESLDIYEHRLLAYALHRLEAYIKRCLAENLHEWQEKQEKEWQNKAENVLKRYPVAESLDDLQKIFSYPRHPETRRMFLDAMLMGEQIEENLDCEESSRVYLNAACSQYTEPSCTFINGRFSTKYTFRHSPISGCNVTTISVSSNDLSQHCLLWRTWAAMRHDRAKVTLTLSGKWLVAGTKQRSADCTTKTIQYYELQSVNRYKPEPDRVDEEEALRAWYIFGLRPDGVNDSPQLFMNYEEEREYLDKLIQQRGLIQGQGAELSNLEDNLVASILEGISLLLGKKFLHGLGQEREAWQITQIFANDPAYRRAYILLSKLEQKFNYCYSPSVLQIIHKKADALYEYWLLLKIMEVLLREQKWELCVVKRYDLFKDRDDEDRVKIVKTNPRQGLIRVIRDFLAGAAANNKLEGIAFDLKHKNCHDTDTAIKMQVAYNIKIFGEGQGAHLTPDFSFKVQASNRQKPVFFFLDAKYRNYGEMGVTASSISKQLIEDLDVVCAKNYLHRMRKQFHLDARAAYIVHTDAAPSDRYVQMGGYFQDSLWQDMRFYTGGSLPNQQLGAFYCLPGTTSKYLKTFLAMIMEYHFPEEEWWRICWNCGNVETQVVQKTTARNYLKYHISCPQCQSFWVKSHCFTEGHNLVKHEVNYHQEAFNGYHWYVVCPVCGCS